MFMLENKSTRMGIFLIVDFSLFIIFALLGLTVSVSDAVI